MDCSAGMGEAPWEVTGGSDDDGDWGHFRVWTIVEAEHVNGESREHKMVDSPGHWSSCSLFYPGFGPLPLGPELTDASNYTITSIVSITSDSSELHLITFHS